MMNEISLHNKINKLQTELLKFHKRISPVKNQDSEKGILAVSEGDKFRTICVEIAFGLLKICVCFLGPATFPAIVFCLEGTSPLFWQVTTVSCIVTMLLIIMIVTILYANVKNITHRITEKIVSARNDFNKRAVYEFFSEVLASDPIKKNIHDILYLSFLAFMWSLISFMSYMKNIPIIFYGSLISTGFVSGILSNLVYNVLNNPDLLPFHTPRKIEMHVIAPSPEAKRRLDFTSHLTPDLNPEFRTKLNNTRFEEKNTKFTGTKNTTNLPNIPMATSEERVWMQTLQLPENLCKFFRRLSF